MTTQAAEIQDLRRTLRRYGFEITDLVEDDGTELLHDPTDEDLLAVGDAIVWLRFQDGSTTWARLIIGGVGPGEMVADWGVSKNESLEAALDAAVDEFSDRWAY